MNTALKIRQFLESNESATVDQLSRVLDLSKADIHYHIRLALAQGEITALPDSYQSGAGRPARQFKLVKPAPETLSRLLIKILVENRLSSLTVTGQRKDLAGYLATGILEHICGKSDAKTSPTIRLTRMVKRLSSHGIHLRWLAGKTGPEIQVEQEFLSTLLQDEELVQTILQILLARIKQKIA